MPHSSLINLQHVQAPKVLVALVLLLGWLDSPPGDCPPAFDVFEVFAGKQAITKEMCSQGYRVASYDRTFQPKAMEFNAAPGFLLALWVIMHTPVHSLLHLAPDCSSWGLPARGTSMRNFINWAGNVQLSWVRSANTMVSRSVLRILVALSRNLVWTLEQPMNSLLCRHRRFQWLSNHVCFVLEKNFSMTLHGSPSPKPTTLYSNMREIGDLYLGPLTKREREFRTTAQLTRKYISKDGRPRFVGNRDELGKSQQYPEGFARNLRLAYEKHLGTHAPGRRELRFKPQMPVEGKSDVQIFRQLPLGDLWEEASLLDCLAYLMSSKRVRIPPEWMDTMTEFETTYRSHVLGSESLLAELQGIQEGGS